MGGGGKGVTKAKSITLYVRKKKGVKTKTALGEHTQHISETSSLENVLPSSSSTPLDASQINDEMQPHSPFYSNLLLHNLHHKFLLILS